jgi:N-acetylneuraminic acid mutarotase
MKTKSLTAKMQTYFFAIMIALFWIMIGISTITGFSTASAQTFNDFSSREGESFVASHNSWSMGLSMPIPTLESAAATLDGMIFVIGGQNNSGVAIANVQIYNPANNHWSTGVPLRVPTVAASAAVVNNLLYVFGGAVNGAATGNVWAYNPTTKTWTREKPMPTPRGATSAVVRGTFVYVIGGTFFAIVERYNTANNTWSEEPSMLEPKQFPAAGLLGTTIVAADGATAYAQISSEVEGYDPASDAGWMTLASDPTTRVGSCYGVISGKLYNAGGYPANSAPATTITEVFNLSGDQWLTLAPMLQGTMYGSSAVAGRRLYCFGGWETFGGNVLSNVQIYQP